MRLKRLVPILLAASLLLWAGARLVGSLRSFNPSDVSADPISAWDSHMRVVLTSLPTDVHVVGYLEGADLDPSIPGRDQAEFYLTQYSLAPVVVEPGANHDWIVGNFGNAFQPDQVRIDLDQRLGPASIEDLGFGIYLIHRLSR